MGALKIFIGNYKGGVGKTVSTYYLAHYFAQKIGKVLLIDLDPQCSLTEVCMKSIGGRELFDLEDDECLNNVFYVYQQSKKYPNLNFTMNKQMLIKQCKNNNSNVYFIPSNLYYKKGGLDQLATSLISGQKNDVTSLFILEQFIRDNKIDEEFSLILFDCPPSNNIITQGAFLYSDYYLIPTIMDSLSIKGVDHYIETIEDIYRTYCELHDDSRLIKLVFGNKPRLLGAFETMRKGPSYVREEDYRKNATFKIYKTIIKDINDVADSLSTGNISSKYSFYQTLADEIIADL